MIALVVITHKIPAPPDRKKSELPEWARKYDGKGISFRRMADGSFHLFRVTSKTAEGKSYPVLGSAKVVGVSRNTAMRYRSPVLSGKDVQVGETYRMLPEQSSSRISAQDIWIRWPFPRLSAER